MKDRMGYEYGQSLLTSSKSKDDSCKLKDKPRATNMQAWGKLCHETSCEIWPISTAINQENTGLYMTQRSYWELRDKVYESPVYQVWINDERELVVMNENDALAYWLRRVKELGLQVKNYIQIDMTKWR